MTISSELNELIKPLVADEETFMSFTPEPPRTGIPRKLVGLYKPVGDVPPTESVINTLANDGYKNIIDYKINEDGVEVYNNALATEADVIGSMRGINYEFVKDGEGNQNEQPNST